MALFVLICTDRPGAGAVRAATREVHLAYIDALGEAVRLAGPMVGEDGETAGSLILVEAADLAAARAIADADPYGRAGVFANVVVRSFRVSRGKLG